MSSKTDVAAAAADLDDLLTVRLDRVLPAAPQRVYDAWTTGEIMQKWWGPQGFTCLSASADPKPGGAFSVEMKGPDGQIHVMGGIYTELTPPSLVCLEIRHRQFAGAADRPGGYIPTQVRIELMPHRDGTEIRVLHTGFLEAAQAERFNGGWAGSLDHLAEYLAA